MTRILLFVLAAALAATPAWSADLPAMGSSASRTLSPDDEAAIGRQVLRDLREAGYVLDDPAATEYLQSLGQRLASVSGDRAQRYTFFLVDSTDINAFALPGGYIGINSGLIMTTANESELAGVVAHEIAHVSQRHIARQFEQAGRFDTMAAAAILAAILVGAASGSHDVAQAGIAVGQSAMIQNRINFTRAHEHEADRVGINTLAAAGFDPMGMATMFETMEQRARLSGTFVPDFLRTHPVSAERIAEARDRAGKAEVATPRNSRAYLLMRARVRALSSEPTEAVRWFRATLGAAPVHEHEALRYGLALALTEAGQADEARPMLEALVAGGEDIVYYHLALAAAEFKARETESALARYELAMRVFPRSVAVTQAYAQSLLYLGRGREALSHLVALLPQAEGSPQLYRLLAMSSGAAGELADAHYFMSEVHVLSGDLMPAIDQLQLALSIPEINQQQRRRAEARLEQLSAYLPRGHRARLDRPIPQQPTRRR
ncbi:MAG: M48 family metalloprotease [Gammaproteobacteria bacterium]